MSVNVRLAGLGDLDALTPLFDAYRIFYGQASDPALARRFLDARQRAGESMIFLAECDGKPAGFTQLFPGFTSVGAGRVWLLNDLFVDPAFRGKGVGGSLLERAAAFGRADGAIRLVLSTAVTNKTAQALYARHGWKPDSDFLHYKLAL